MKLTGSLDLKSRAKLTADGTLQAEVKAAKVAVTSSGLTEVKGALVKIN